MDWDGGSTVMHDWVNLPKGARSSLCGIVCTMLASSP
jgi:hypothetical protein